MSNATLALAQTLIACRSLTPADDGCHQQPTAQQQGAKFHANSTVLEYIG